MVLVESKISVEAVTSSKADTNYGKQSVSIKLSALCSESYLSILTSSAVSSLKILINFKDFCLVGFCSKCLHIHNIPASLRKKEKRKKSIIW